MSASVRRIIRVGIALGILLLAIRVSRATPPDICDSFCVAKRLLAVFYPELRGERAMVKISGDSPFDVDGPMVSFQLAVSTSLPVKPGVGVVGAPAMENRLTAQLRISPGPGGIQEMQSFGSEVNEEKVEQLSKLVAAHEGWSEAQLVEALEASGAKFRPSQKEAIVRALPLSELEPLLGQIRLESVTFETRSNSVPPLPLLDWGVKFTATRASTVDHCILLLEPFDGRVSALHCDVRNAPTN
jgi:hypothetical protein